MTTSTQAQIEAAEIDRYIVWLRKLALEGGKGMIGNVDARSLGRIADKLVALTAAAAVVGPPALEQGSDPNYDNHIIRSTIERCAQIAEGTNFLDYTERAGEIIAAEIRKLKD